MNASATPDSEQAWLYLAHALALPLGAKAELPELEDACDSLFLNEYKQSLTTSLDNQVSEQHQKHKLHVQICSDWTKPSTPQYFDHCFCLCQVHPHSLDLQEM
jgi:hypothetical protein